MMMRLLTQAVLALSLFEFVPIDGAALEQAADLPTSPVRAPIVETVQLAADRPVLPTSDDRYPTKVDLDTLGIVTTAESVLVVDRKTGMPLYQKQPTLVRSVGSITKLMTALVVLDLETDLSAPVSVLSEDYRAGGRVYLAFNDPVTAFDLLEATLVGSDNSATMALVRQTGLSEEEFVQRMNKKAETLGMASTQFVEPTGLSPRNMSTAEDIILLLGAAMESETIRLTTTLPVVSVEQGSGRTVTIESTDVLLQSYLHQDPYRIIGGKTGYLPEAGYCMGIGVNHAEEGEIFIVLLGADSKSDRTQEIKGLSTWAFDTYDWP